MSCSPGDSAVGKQIVKIPFGCIEPITGEVDGFNLRFVYFAIFRDWVRVI